MGHELSDHTPGLDVNDWYDEVTPVERATSQAAKDVRVDERFDRLADSVRSLHEKVDKATAGLVVIADGELAKLDIPDCSEESSHATGLQRPADLGDASRGHACGPRGVSEPDVAPLHCEGDWRPLPADCWARIHSAFPPAAV